MPPKTHKNRTTVKLFDHGGYWHVDLRTYRGHRSCSTAVKVKGPKSKRDAFEVAVGIVAEVSGQPELPGLARPRSFADCARAWFDSAKFESEKTREYYRSHTDMLIRELGSVPISEFEGRRGFGTVEAYQEVMHRKKNRRGRPFAKKTILHRQTTIRNIVGYAYDREWIDAVPRKWPKVAPRHELYPIRMTWADSLAVSRLVAEVCPHERRLCESPVFDPDKTPPSRRPRRDPGRVAAARDLLERRRLWIKVAYFTGMRRSHVDGMRWRDINLAAGTYIRRSKKNRAKKLVMLLPAVLRDALEARWARVHPGPNDFVAGRWCGVYEALEHACERLGMPRLTPNDFRRSHVTPLAGARVPKSAMLMSTGHKNSVVFDEIYEQIPEEELRAITAALDALPWDESGQKSGRVCALPGVVPGDKKQSTATNSRQKTQNREV